MWWALGKKAVFKTVQTWKWGSGQPGISTNFLGEHRKPELNVKLYEVQKLSRERSGQGGVAEGSGQREHRVLQGSGRGVWYAKNEARRHGYRQ